MRDAQQMLNASVFLAKFASVFWCFQFDRLLFSLKDCCAQFVKMSHTM